MTTTQNTTTHSNVTLGATTYTVEYWADSDMTVLTGPRGAQYFLRGFLYRNAKRGDTGLRQVISFKSGQPLRVKGNEVRVYHIGDTIEVA